MTIHTTKYCGGMNIKASITELFKDKSWRYAAPNLLTFKEMSDIKHSENSLLVTSLKPLCSCQQLFYSFVKPSTSPMVKEV